VDAKAIMRVGNGRVDFAKQDYDVTAVSERMLRAPAVCIVVEREACLHYRTTLCLPANKYLNVGSALRTGYLGATMRVDVVYRRCASVIQAR
jgi:hypothetical protein